MTKKRKQIFLGILIALAAVYGLYSIISSSDSATNDIPSASEALVQTQVIGDDEKAKTQDHRFVYITGAIENPGVYAMNDDITVQALVTKAGGLLPYADTASVNLADRIDSGTHIHIPFNYTGNPEALLRKPLVNINSATEEELQTLPGVGKAIAKRIVDYRTANGSFKSIEDIKQVKGIGDGMFKKWASKITV